MSLAVYPVVEGDSESKLTLAFDGKVLGHHFDKLVDLAMANKATPLNDFEYFDPEMLAEMDIDDLADDVAHPEWFSPADGINAINWLLARKDLPKVDGLREELEQLVEILKSVPVTSKGWRFEMDF